MAQQHYQSILAPYTPNTVEPGAITPGLDLPFAPKVIKVDEQTNEITVIISPYSEVLLGTSINNNLFIIGLQCPLVIKYGDKVWLEIFFDLNNTPVCGVIRTGKKWATQYYSNSNNNNKQDIYPEVVDLITTRDIADRTTELNTINQEILELKNDYSDSIDLLVTRGYYTNEEGEDRKKSFNDEYTDFKKIFDTFVGNLNSYFSDTSYSFLRKQFRLYVPITYTTNNLTNDIQGQNVSAGTIDKSQGSVKVAGETVEFKVVAAQNSNLLIVDSAYKNLYPAKITIPYFKPIYFSDEDSQVINS